MTSLARHPFLVGIAAEHVALLARYARPVTFPAGHRIFAEDGIADRFWLIVDGQVALDLHVSGRGTLLVETLGRGDVLGWSWLFPPYRWRFGAVAVTATAAIEFAAPAVRKLCYADAVLGQTLTARFIAVVVDRLQATRLRLLDLYAEPRPGAVP